MNASVFWVMHRKDENCKLLYSAVHNVRNMNISVGISDSIFIEIFVTC